MTSRKLRSDRSVGRLTTERRRNRVDVRQAFTLMETLAALTILGLVVSSLGASLHLYWKYRSVSRTQITLAQLQRGLIEDLTSDIRMALQDPAAVRVASLAESQSRSLPENAGTERFLDVTEQFLELPADLHKRPIHLVGTSGAIAMLHNQKNHRFHQADPTYRETELCHVVWWVNKGESQRLPLFHSGPQQIPTSVNASRIQKGLVRKVCSGAGEASVPSLDSDEISVAESVTNLTLRYFDGQDWKQEWNSLEQQRLPLAIEVRISLGDGAEFTIPVVIWLPQASC